MDSTLNPPDLLAVFGTFLALAFSPALAAILAPYVVILVGALAGTGWGLKRREPTTRAGTWSFVALMLATALIFTMPAAVWLQRYTGAGSYQWLLAPLAALIAAVGDDWPRLVLWAWDQRGELFRRNT